MSSLLRFLVIESAIAEAFLKWGAGDKPMTRFFSPSTRAGSGVARNFKREGGHNFRIFFIVFFFFGKTNFKLIKKQEKL